MRLKAREKTAVALFDDGRRGVVRADDVESRYLTLLNELPRRLHLLFGCNHPSEARKQVTRLLDIGFVVPAVVKHRLGQPLVGVVFEQIVDERDHRIAGDDGTWLERLFEASNQRGRVHDRLDLPTLVGQKKRRDQLHLRPRQLIAAREPLKNAVGNLPIPEKRQHLLGVRRARGSAKKKWRW